MPISPNKPDDEKLPEEVKLPSVYATENVPEFVAGVIVPSQRNGPSGSLRGTTSRGAPDAV